MTDDRQLLASYAAEVSEEAFAELARRHTPLVYSAALRQVRDPQMAQDVTQVVFANLARRARSIPAGAVLAGWLHRDTRYTALDFLRAEARRLRREQQSVAMNPPHSEHESGWADIRPLLDEALTKLPPDDRDALLLRYFEQRDFAGVGAALGASAEAARKRVDRALQRLREHLAKRGIATTAAALSGALTAHAVETVPTSLVVSLAAGSAAAVTVGTGGWISNLILMTKTKLVLGAAVLAGVIATPLIMQQQMLGAARAEQADLQGKLRDLAAQPAPAAAPVSPRIDLAARDHAELERLRTESAELRAKITEFTARAQQLAAANPAHKQGGVPIGDVLRLRDLHEAGQATPAATMQSFMSAMFQGDSNRIAQLVVVDGDNSTEASRVGALEKIFKESVSMRSAEALTNVDKLEVNLVEEQPGQNGDRWVVGQTTQPDGHNHASRILLRPSVSGWQCVVNTNGDPVEEEIPDQQ